MICTPILFNMGGGDNQSKGVGGKLQGNLLVTIL